MGAWTGWLIPIVATLLLGAAATFYLRRIRLPREETEAGIAALAGMRWRDYIHLVLSALNLRGYGRVFQADATSDESDYLLERNGQSWLLSSKHGTAYVLGSTAIAEFASAIRMRGAAGGLLVTSGHFAPEAKPLAAAQRIELLDGPALWPELRPLLPEEQRAVVSAPAQARARRHVLLVWGGALVIGALLFVFGPHGESEPAMADAATPAPRAATMPPPQPQVAVAAGTPMPNDPAQLEQRRNDAAHAISTLPMVDRALWSTQSTLLVYLLDAQADPLHDICPLLERYDELGASRIQLQPPPNSALPVRFVQCRAF
ncbi:MAG TPA: restriction endonuclease [Luteimonas sp.]|nr:restriction endonuclease [Luteimonas sp.]